MKNNAPGPAEHKKERAVHGSAQPVLLLYGAGILSKYAQNLTDLISGESIPIDLLSGKRPEYVSFSGRQKSAAAADES